MSRKVNAKSTDRRSEAVQDRSRPATRGTRRSRIAYRELSEILTEITGIARQATPSVQAASVTLIREDQPFRAVWETDGAGC